MIERAIAGGVVPAATVEVGGSADIFWQDAFGSLTFDPAAPVTASAHIETPFDLASLTKPIATTTLVMRLVATGLVRLDEPVDAAFDEWRGADRKAATIRDLLEHAAGLSARLIDAAPEGRREFEHEIATMPLEYALRTRSVYSDLGFVLLGFLVADRGGASLDGQFADCMRRLRIDGLMFRLPAGGRRLAAPTRPMDEDPRRGRMLAGEVHDTYAAALCGVAGHAGLFGAAPAVGAFARALLRSARGDRAVPSPLSPAEVAAMTSRSTVPGSSRALGWDTMLTTSSCGTRMSASAFGHVGFTGTSLWIDPERDRYFVLLTNRASGGGSLDAMRDTRRAFHDALGDL